MKLRVSDGTMLTRGWKMWNRKSYHVVVESQFDYLCKITIPRIAGYSTIVCNDIDKRDDECQPGHKKLDANWSAPLGLIAFGEEPLDPLGPFVLGSAIRNASTR